MLELLIGIGLFGAGYAFRGVIGRELKKIVPEVTAEFAKLVAEAKAELTKVVSEVKAKV